MSTTTWHSDPVPDRSGPCQDRRISFPTPIARMASSPGAYHVIDNEPPEEAEVGLDAARDNDDVISSESTYLGKPSESFDIEDDADVDVEDGLVTRNPNQRRKKGWLRFWDSMTVRQRRKGGDKEQWLELRQRGRRKGHWYNCCIFGGISGLCILYVAFSRCLSFFSC